MKDTWTWQFPTNKTILRVNKHTLKSTECVPLRVKCVPLFVSFYFIYFYFHENLFVPVILFALTRQITHRTDKVNDIHQCNRKETNHQFLSRCTLAHKTCLKTMFRWDKLPPCWPQFMDYSFFPLALLMYLNLILMWGRGCQVGPSKLFITFFSSFCGVSTHCPAGRTSVIGECRCHWGGA